MGRLLSLNKLYQTPQLLFRISMSVETLYALVAGDYVEAQVFQNSGNPLLIRPIPATSPEFATAKLP